MRKVLTFVLTAGAALTLATGCTSGSGSGTGRAQAPGVPASSPSVPTSPVPSASPTPTPSASAPSTPTRPAAPRKLKAGATGAAVVALQQRLTELGYWNGKADGNFGDSTQQGVYALQKAAGLGRDGTVGPKTQKALDDGVRPKAKSKTGSGYLVEINLSRQLLMFVRDGQVLATLNTSTGSNMHYTYQGDTFLADTPPGHFRVGRQIDGWRHGPLGPLWRPKYFNGGIAVHGAPSVPAYPASHGCARVSISAMNWIWSTDKIPMTTRIWVYRA